jgi:geranylgeranyl diphosphate synthase type I
MPELSTLELTEAEAFIRTYRQRADRRLAELMTESGSSIAGLPFNIQRYYRDLEEYVLRGGKRFRGALVALGIDALGANVDAAFDATLSFELLHASLLALDDIMDRDELRRGGQALHVAAAQTARELYASDPTHRGLSATLLLSLFAQTQSFDAVARVPISEAAKARALAYLNRVLQGVTVGQLLDVCAADAKAATAEDVSAIHQRKTGLYTTEGPLVLGALLTGVTESDPRVVALKNYARPLGEAFQLVDDVLGVVGDVEQTGKQTASDLREAKRTAVIEEALARAREADRQRLLSTLGQSLDAEAAGWVRRLLAETGAVEAVLGRARSLAAAAQQALESASFGAKTRKLLAGLAALVVTRSA